MSPQAVQGDYISDLNPVVTTVTELPGGLFEVEVLTGPVAGAYVSKRLTVEQLVAYVLSQATAPALTLTALAELIDIQNELRNDRAPFTPGVRYNITGDWNASGDPTQVVYVQAATVNSLEKVGTLHQAGQPDTGVEVDVVAGTAVPSGGSFTTFDLLNPPDSVRDAVRDPSNTWAYGDLLAYGNATLQDAGAPPEIAGQDASILVGTADVQPGQGFDAFEKGSTTIAWRYRYERRNDGTSGWTRIGKTA
jgi:hypothetical protein